MNSSLFSLFLMIVYWENNSNRQSSNCFCLVSNKSFSQIDSFSLFVLLPQSLYDGSKYRFLSNFPKICWMLESKN